MKIIIKAHPTISELMESKAIIESVLVNKTVYSQSETQRVIEAFKSLPIVEVIPTGRENPHFKICNINEVLRMVEIPVRLKLVARYTPNGDMYKTIAKK